MEQLPLLPLLTKAEAIAHQEELTTGRAFPFVGSISSGTMHGEQRPLRVLRTEAELEARLELERALSWGEPRRGRGGLVLEIRAVHHGIPDRMPPDGRIRIPWFYGRNAFRLAEEMLSRPQADGRRVTAVVVGAGALMPLTAHFLERGVDPARFRVRRIATTGFRLSPHWRKLVQQSWDAEVYDNFSLSEFDTPALECKSCGFNHWLLPTQLAEVLDPFTRAPVSRGTGALVLTGLYPFSQAMPLIRYWTGDLVELGPRCDRAPDRGLLFRGRIGQSLLRRGLPGQPLLVSASDVSDFLEGRWEVARHPHPCETLGLVASSDIGAVKFECAMVGRPSHPRVAVELRFDPKVYVAEAEAVGRDLARFLLSQSPRLKQLEARGETELEVELRAPGGVAQRWSKY